MRLQDLMRFAAGGLKGHRLRTGLSLLGVAIGVGASQVAAAGPAWEAARCEPRSASRRSEIETRAHRLVPWLAALGALSGVLGAALLWAPGRGLVIAFTALFLVILGFALTVPALTLLLARAVSPLLGRLAGSLGRLAAAGLVSGLSRSGLAVAALTVAVAASVGVSIMIHSFRGAVEDWLALTLRSDIYVSGPETAADSADASAPGNTAAISCWRWRCGSTVTMRSNSPARKRPTARWLTACPGAKAMSWRM